MYRLQLLCKENLDAFWNMYWILPALKNIFWEKSTQEPILSKNRAHVRPFSRGVENSNLFTGKPLCCRFFSVKLLLLRSGVYSCNLIKKNSNTEVLPYEFYLTFKVNKTFLQDIFPKYFLTKLLTIYRLQVYWKWCLVKICVKLIHIV